MSGERCETCKHWQPGPFMHIEYDIAVAKGEAEPYAGWHDRHDEDEVAFLQDIGSHPWGRCRRVSEVGFDQEKGSRRFLVRDASGYRATLNTRADFGCTEHEPGSFVPGPSGEWED